MYVFLGRKISHDYLAFSKSCCMSDSVHRVCVSCLCYVRAACGVRCCSARSITSDDTRSISTLSVLYLIYSIHSYPVGLIRKLASSPLHTDSVIQRN